MVIRVFAKALGFGLAGVGATMAASELASASADMVHAAKIQFPHTGWFDTYDHQALRRGYQVYRQVCAACHSMNFVHYRSLVGVTHTEAEMKEIASEEMVYDAEPGEDGNPFKRPGKLTDKLPNPYENEVQARIGNNGAYPPDMSLIRHARTHQMEGHYGENYIFHLLTGYCDPPTGVTVAEGQYYNPYFHGGGIGMAPPIYNEIIQYEDGTPASMSQIAYDVSQFLTWASMPEHDERKQMAFKFFPMLGLFIASTWITKRYIWAGTKSGKTMWKQFK